MVRISIRTFSKVTTTSEALRRARISNSLRRRRFLTRDSDRINVEQSKIYANRKTQLYDSKKVPLSRIRDGVHCIYCGTPLEKDVNWFLTGETSGRLAYVCGKHEKLLSKDKEKKIHHCRLCGKVLEEGYNWSPLVTSYVCVVCLLNKTTDTNWLRSAGAGKLLVQRAHLLSALELQTSKKHNKLSLHEAERSHLVHLTEQNLQEFIMMCMYGTNLKAEKEFSVNRYRVDIVIPSLKLAIELKRFFYSGRTSKKREKEYIESCVAQKKAYEKALGSSWSVYLVSPLGSVPESIGVSEVLDVIHKKKKIIGGK